jgi:hypothetical protein
MWLGILLACAVPTNASSCEVKLDPNKRYVSKDACVTEMNGVANYAVSVLGLTARPYCFPMNKTI